MSSFTTPCLSSCTAHDLSQYLLDGRFEGDATKAATFLLETLDKIPNIEEINESLIQTSSGIEDTNQVVNVLGARIESIPQINNIVEPSSSITVSAVVPRSKFTLIMYEKGCSFSNNKNEKILVKKDDIKHIIMFPRREDCVKAPKLSKASKDKIDIPGSMILLVLKGDKVEFKGKKMTKLCFQLPQHLSESSHDPRKVELAKSNISDDFESKWEQLLQSSFQNKIVRIYNPRFNNLARKLNKFQSDEGNPDSSMIQGGMLYVKCYRGVNDGVLYPIDEGLLFYKPPAFIHRSELHSIACGRGAGGSSRFADLIVTLDKENEVPLEFTNIDKEEVEGLNNYINNILVKAMARDAKDEEISNNQSDDSEESSDEEKMEEENRKRKPQQRSASVHARKATKVQLHSSATDDISDDDEDFDESCSESDEELLGSETESDEE